MNRPEAGDPRVGEGKRGVEAHCSYLPRQAAGALRGAMDRPLEPAGITQPQCAVAAMLSLYPGAFGAELARLTQLTPQTLTVITRDLAAATLVRRGRPAAHPARVDRPRPFGPRPRKAGRGPDRNRNPRRLSGGGSGGRQTLAGGGGEAVARAQAGSIGRVAWTRGGRLEGRSPAVEQSAPTGRPLRDGSGATRESTLDPEPTEWPRRPAMLGRTSIRAGHDPAGQARPVGGGSGPGADRDPGTGAGVGSRN